MTISDVKTTVKEPVNELPFIVRVIWFFVFGWELAGGWILVAWLLNASIIGLPLGLWMIDRVPMVLTLKARSGAYLVDEANGRYQFIPQNQSPFLIRTLYFFLFGWWFSLIWAGIAWLLCLTIIGLPLGVIMLNGLPAITTLRSV